MLNRWHRHDGARLLALAAVISLGLLGCIDSKKATQEQGGDAQFFTGQPSASQDYSDGMPATGVGAPTNGEPTIGTQPGAGTAPATGTQPGTSTMPGDGATGTTPPSGAAGTDGTATDPTATDMTGAAGMGGTDPATDPVTDPTTDPATDPTTDPATDPAPSAQPGMLTISFRTVNLGGRYSPRNVGAVWIETGSGQFVKTLARWAGVRAQHLTTWTRASGGWSSFFGFGATADELDAVSTATLRSHETHMLTWDMIDNNEQVVPDGTYKVWIECTDSETSTSAGSVEFEKGASPVQLNPPDQKPWADLSISYQP